MNMETYIIALKRDRRGSEPPNWKELIGRTGGIQILNGGPRLQVRASEADIDEIRSNWGHLFLIEKEILHKPQSALGA